MNYRHRWQLPVLLALLAFVVSACTTSAAPASNEAKSPLRVGTIPWAGYGPAFIAVKRGMFKAEGIEVEFNGQYQNFEVLTQDFVTKKLDISTQLGVDMVALAARGIPIEGFWVFDETLGADVIVGLPSIASPADLKGKRIGLGYGTFSHIFVLRALAKYGLTEADVKIVNFKEDQVTKALADGEIDAGHTWEPYLSAALNAGNKVILTSKDTPNTLFDVFVVRKEFAVARSDDLTAFVRALNKAMDWWIANPEEGDKIVAEAVGMKPEEMPAMRTVVNFWTAQDNLAWFGLPDTDPRSPKQISQIFADFFLQYKIIDKAPDLTTLYNPKFLSAATAGK